MSVAVNLASNRMANVSQDGNMEAVFKSEHLGKEWLAGRALDDHLFSPHTQTQTNAHTILHTHTHTRAHTHTQAHTNAEDTCLSPRFLLPALPQQFKQLSCSQGLLTTKAG